MGSVNYKKIKAEYIAGGTSYRELAKKHGVSFNTLKTHAVEEEWYKLRQQANNKATTKMVETISTKQAEKAVDISDVADKLLGKISEMLDMDVNAYNTQNIKNLASALKDIKEIKGFKTEADKIEQMARIAKLQKEAMSEADKDNEIKVTIEGDLELYSK